MCENYAGKSFKKSGFLHVVFARRFPEIIRVLQLFHLLLKNGLVIAQDELWVLWIYYIQGYLFFDWIFICIIWMVYPKNVSILTAPGFKVKFNIHHRPFNAATNRSLLARRYNFVGNSSGNKEFLPEHPWHHPLALSSIIGATMSFFNRIIGWQRSARYGS